MLLTAGPLPQEVFTGGRACHMGQACHHARRLDLVRSPLHACTMRGEVGNRGVDGTLLALVTGACSLQRKVKS